MRDEEKGSISEKELQKLVVPGKTRIPSATAGKPLSLTALFTFLKTPPSWEVSGVLLP